MRILFYSTNSNIFDGEKANLQTRPLLKKQWEDLAKSHPEDTFLIATQLPGMFLIDVKENEILDRAKRVEYHLIEEDNEEKIADFLASLKPDIAIAATFYTPPFDWLGIKDSIVAQKMRGKGIKTVCHPLESEVICFDKWRTHQAFEKFGVPCAKAVYFNHELFINGGSRREIKSNVYKAAFFEELKNLKYPVIIKDTTGLSSYGMDVAQNFEEARAIILSKKTTSSRIIEEMLQGGQFGLEAVRTVENGESRVKIFPPFKFSVNKYGITSPKQSVKVGPIFDSEKYCLKNLYKTIYSLCEKINLDGNANFDLVFNEDKKEWFVLEINPRLSGMTTTYASSMGKSVSEMLFEIAKNKPEDSNSFRPAMNIKFPLLSPEKIEKASSLPFVDFVNQQENLGARQLREKGYSEMIFSAGTFGELKNNLNMLKETFREEMEETFFEKAQNLLDSL